MKPSVFLSSIYYQALTYLNLSSEIQLEANEAYFKRYITVAKGRNGLDNLFQNLAKEGIDQFHLDLFLLEEI